MSGQIIATSHVLTPNVGFSKGNTILVKYHNLARYVVHLGEILFDLCLGGRSAGKPPHVGLHCVFAMAMS